MDEIIAICKKHNAILIEDAAEALSAKYKGQKCGTFGEYNAISFDKEDKAIINREKCVNCLKCSNACPTGAISTQGKIMTIKELINHKKGNY